MARGEVGAGPRNPTKRTIEDLGGFDGPRDQWDRPLILPPHSTKGKGVAHTRASTLGGTLESEFALGQWRARMALWGMAKRRDILLAVGAIDDPNETQKKELGELCDAALEAAETQGAARVGTALHAVTLKVDQGEPVPELFEDHRDALEAYRDKMSRFHVHASEVFVVAEQYKAAGTFDRLVSPRGWMRAPDGTPIGPQDHLILDLKTSGSSDYFGVKFCVQCVIYAAGKPYRHPGRYLDWPDGIAPRTDWALILWVPSRGSTAELFWVSLERGHDLALLARDVMAWRKNKHLITPADDPADEDWSPGLHAVPDIGSIDPDAGDGPDGDNAAADEVTAHDAVTRADVPDPQPDPQPGDSAPADATITTAIRGASSEAALVALWERFSHRWTDAHTEAAGARSRELAGSS